MTTCRLPIQCCALAMTAWAGLTFGAPARAASEATPAAAPALTWATLVERVERTSPLMAAARAGLDTFEAKLKQARFANLPIIKFEAGGFAWPDAVGDAFSVDLEDDADWGWFGQVRLSILQPIYTFGRIRALRRAAGHGIDVGQAQVEAARWELRHRAAQAWYGHLLGVALRSILDDGQSWIDKSEARMAKQRDEDSDDYDQLEHMRLKSRVAEFHQLEADNRRVEAASMAGLRALLSLPIDAPIDTGEARLAPIELQVLPAERYVEAAETHASRLLLAQAAARARAGLADARAADMWPQLVLGIDVRYSETNIASSEIDVSGTDFNRGFSGGPFVGLRWNLDVGQRLARRDEARAQAAQAREQAAAARQLLLVQVQELAVRLSEQKRLIKEFARSRKAAQGWLTATWDLYDTGFGSFRDVMDALGQFYARRMGYLKVVHDHNVLVWELSALIGADITALAPATPAAGAADR